ncbi:MAG: transposase family protein [Gemmatimonadaceae bacterium]
MTTEQYEELVARVRERLPDWHAATGRPRALSLEAAVRATCLYLRANVTEDLIAEVHGADQSTISRVIAALEEVIAEVLAEFVPPPAEMVRGRVPLVDGTLCPCWSWRNQPELYSGKHKRTGFSVQILADLDGNLLAVSEPRPGSWHDTRAYTDVGFADLVGNTGIGDKGYVGTGLATPIKRRRGRDLTEADRALNANLGKLRAPVERAIANFKTWRILHTDYRRPAHTFPKALRAVTALHFFQTSFA